MGEQHRQGKIIFLALRLVCVYASRDGDKIHKLFNSGKDSVNPTLKVSNLSITGRHPLVQNLSFCVPAGKVVALYGPSGAGKSTTLLAIAGLLDSGLQQAGRIQLLGHDITNRRPEDIGRLGLAIVLQGLALFPHLTVLQNVAYPLLRRGLSRPEARERAMRSLKSFYLERHFNRKPENLSGGEQQRVAIARATITGPSVLLLDEPFKGLDQTLRDDLLGLVASISAGGTSILLVTHEQREIELTSDIVVPIVDGRLAQSPEHRNDDPSFKPFETIASKSFFPGHDNAGECWIRAEDLCVEHTSRGTESVEAHVVTSRNLGGNRSVALCRYTDGGFVWIETPERLVAGERIAVARRHTRIGDVPCQA